MMIIGAKGFAKEVLQVLFQLSAIDEVVFFDDISTDLPALLYEKFEIIRNFEGAKYYFQNIDKRFTIGLGQPQVRECLAKKFEKLSGQITTVISPKADVGAFNTVIGNGVNIMTGTVITNDVQIAEGCLINLNCTIGHDTHIGKFTEFSPGVHISGNCKIGSFCIFGTGAVVLPKVKIGDNVTVGAGAVVTKDIGNNEVVVGIPARMITNHPQ